MNVSDASAGIGGVLVGVSLYPFIGWWAVSLTAGLAFLCAGLGQYVVEEVRGE